MSNFPYKTAPFQHQREILNRMALRTFFGIHLEQGLGKSKILIDNAAFLWFRGKIDGLLIIAPNGVHTSWIEDQLEEHMSDKVTWKALEWVSSRASSKRFQQEYEALLGFKGLAIFAINIDAVALPGGKKAVRNFLQKRRCLTTLDESDMIARPGAKRSKAIHGLYKLSPFRRNLTGTPAGDGSPFDLYSQFKFLEPRIFGTSFTAFKNYYAEMIPAPWENAPEHLEVVKRFKNLNRLNRILSEHSVRLTKDELVAKGQLDIPEKLFKKHYVEMSKEQIRMYRELEEEYITQFIDTGEVVTAAITLTRYIRLQQILMGYVPADSQDIEDPQPVRLIPGPNPRLEALEDYFTFNPGKIIIWARFRLDHELISDRFRKLINMVRYDGNKSKRDDANDRFCNDPDVRVMLANAQSGGRGLTWNMAKHTLFYSNYFALRLRLQAEDRQHRIGLKTMALYTDFICRGSIDVKIVKALRNKKSVSDIITGDPKKDWI